MAEAEAKVEVKAEGLRQARQEESRHRRIASLPPRILAVGQFREVVSNLAILVEDTLVVNKFQTDSVDHR